MHFLPDMRTERCRERPRSSVIGTTRFSKSPRPSQRARTRSFDTLNKLHRRQHALACSWSRRGAKSEEGGAGVRLRPAPRKNAGHQLGQLGAALSWVRYDIALSSLCPTQSSTPMLPKCRCLIGACLQLSDCALSGRLHLLGGSVRCAPAAPLLVPLGSAMQRTPLDNCASFDPETLELLTRAFDEAWPSLAGRCHGYLNMQLKRDALASIIVKLAQNGERDVETLKTTALQAFAQIERPWGR